MRLANQEPTALSFQGPKSICRPASVPLSALDDSGVLDSLGVAVQRNANLFSATSIITRPHFRQLQPGQQPLPCDHCGLLISASMIRFVSED